VVAFRALTDAHLRAILELELVRVQERVLHGAKARCVFPCTDAAKALLLAEGTDYISVRAT
jgi:ATP-dependent Clp protease ATP-binding subunit ClpA